MNAVHNGRESVSFPGIKIWDMLPDDYKDSDNLKIRLKNESLKILLVDSVKFTLII